MPRILSALTTTALLAVAVAPVRAQEAAPVIREVVVSGARSVAPAEVVQAATREVVGKRGDPAVVRLAADAVTREYRSRGFLVAQVVSTDLTPDGTLRLVVAEGTVRRIVVRGNRKTRAATIRDAIVTRPGDVYREENIARDRDSLARLGIFEDVVIAPAPTDVPADTPPARGADANADPDADVPTSEETVAAPLATAPEDTVGLVDVIVRVRERKTGNVAATLGYGSGTGLVGYLDLSEANFAGRAQRVSVQFQRLTYRRFNNNRFDEDEEARSAYSVSYFAPFLGRGRTAFGLDLYDKNTVFQPLFSGEDENLRTYETRRGFTARVGRQLGQNLALFLTGRRDEVGYDLDFLSGDVADDLTPEELDEVFDARDTVGALGLELIADARDAAANPRSGYRYSLAYENAGSLLGGDRTFGRAVADLRRYVPLTRGERGPVLAGRILGGTTTGSVPLAEQFFLGGYELLRGYDLYSVRGDRMLLASLEARLPLNEGLQGAVFVDYGNAWRPDDTFSLADLKAGVGVGLRFVTPIGPIRLDAAYGDSLKTYVSLGQAF